MKWVPLGDHSLARACTQAPPWVCTGPSFATHSAFAERPPRAGSAPRAGSPRSQGARRQTGDMPGIIQSIQCVRRGMPSGCRIPGGERGNALPIAPTLHVGLPALLAVVVVGAEAGVPQVGATCGVFLNNFGQLHHVAGTGQAMCK